VLIKVSVWQSANVRSRAKCRNVHFLRHTHRRQWILSTVNGPLSKMFKEPLSKALHFHGNWVKLQKISDRITGNLLEIRTVYPSNRKTVPWQDCPTSWARGVQSARHAWWRQTCGGSVPCTLRDAVVSCPVCCILLRRGCSPLEGGGGGAGVWIRESSRCSLTASWPSDAPTCLHDSRVSTSQSSYLLTFHVNKMHNDKAARNGRKMQLIKFKREYFEMKLFLGKRLVGDTSRS
jgi:hypothetical protein